VVHEKKQTKITFITKLIAFSSESHSLVKAYKIIILPVVLYGCGIPCFSLKTTAMCLSGYFDKILML